MEHTLLQAIRANPHDEVAWMALGDWLEEQADPRGALLRLSLRLRHDPLEPARRALEAEGVRLILGGLRPCVPELVNSVGMRLALIPAGTFWMGLPESDEDTGADESRHLVEITRPFYLGVFTVTQEQYERVAGHNPSHYRAGGERASEIREVDTSHSPVENVSWEEAEAFCARLSELPEEKAAGRVYRLPTEAEWEYACRAGTTTTFFFGDGLSSALANFNGNCPHGGAEEGPYLGHTCPVGRYPPNAFGLFDMHGNVWEWCADWYDASYYETGPRCDPPGPTSGTTRILRGGCCWSSGSNCRSGNRGSFPPDNRDATTGLRVALTA